MKNAVFWDVMPFGPPFDGEELTRVRKSVRQ
jgi:hypothetical protein